MKIGVYHKDIPVSLDRFGLDGPERFLTNPVLKIARFRKKLFWLLEKYNFVENFLGILNIKMLL